MLHISIEITKLDEDLAERAVNNAYEALTRAIGEGLAAGVVVEPHSTTRGIHAIVSILEPEFMNSSFVQSLTSAFKALLALQIYRTAGKVSVRTTSAMDEENNEG